MNVVIWIKKRVFIKIPGLSTVYMRAANLVNPISIPQFSKIEPPPGFALLRHAACMTNFGSSVFAKKGVRI
jgi:hypothetical protein